MLTLLALATPAQALDDDEYSGYAADTLTVKVGYFGGPYYEKHVFTLNELWALDVVCADYTFIDNMPSVVIDHVAGVRLSDLMDAAGIDLNSVQTFFFWTRDKQSDYYTSYTKAALIDTPRYCYYSLPDNFDDEEGVGNGYAPSDGVPVDTVIALADEWNRTIAGATFGSDYMNLNTNTRFRLIFGQTNGWERTASRSAKWIHEIVVELGGAPTLTLDASVLDGEVGSILRTEPNLSADSAVLENEKVTWASSDESIAAVDENGSITVKSEGTAIITATFADVSASVTVNGTPGEGAGTVIQRGESGGSTAPPDIAPNATTPEKSPPQQTQSVAAAPTDIQEPVEPTTEVKIFQPEVVTNKDKGGVQNWRVYEMSETAAALPNIEVDNPLLGFTGSAVGAMFILSGAVYAAIFYQDIGRKKHVYNRKS